MNLFDRSVSFRQKVLFATILAIALLGRIFTACNTLVIGTDSISFLEMANRMRPWKFDLVEGVNHHVFHPLYAILTAGVRDLIQTDTITAGQSVSAALGFLCIIPLFSIARNLFGTTPALCTAALFAVNPECLENAGDVMSEATFLFFVLTSVAFGLRALERRSPLLSFLASASAGLAYLTRPEGGAAMAVLAGVWLLAARRDRRIALKCLLISLLGFALVAVLYMAHISFIDGTFKPEITLKKPLWSHPIKKPRVVAGLAAVPEATKAGGEKKAEPSPKPSRKTMWPLFEKLPHEYAESVFYFSLLFVLVGVPLSIVQRCRMGGGTHFVVSIMAMTIAVGCLLFFAVGYLSSRHIIVFTVLTLAWAGFGLAAAALWLGARLRLRTVSEGITVATLCIIVMAAHVPKIIKPQRWEELTAKAAGEWIQEQELVGPEEYVITNVSQTLYYAGIPERNRIRVEDSSHLVAADIRRVVAKADQPVRLLVLRGKSGRDGMKSYKEHIDAGEYGEPIRIFGQEVLQKHGIHWKLKDKRKIFVFRVPLERK